MSGAWEDPGNWSNAHPPMPGDNVIIDTSVTITISQDAEIQSLTFANGTLTGGADLQIDGRLTWTRGTMTGTGRTLAEGGISLSGGGVNLGRTLNNDGPASLTGPNSYLNLVTGGSINNTDLFEITNNLGMVGAGSFRNRDTGTLRRSTSSAAVTVPLVLTNDGTVDVQSGSLILTGGGTDTGRFTGASGATLQFGGGTHILQAASQITVPNVVFNGGAVTVNGTYNASVSTMVSGATVTFNPASTVQAIGRTLNVIAGMVTFNNSQTVTPLIVSLAGGTLTGSGNLTCSEIFWSGGSMTGSGTTTMRGLIINGPATLCRALAVGDGTNSAVALVSGANGYLVMNAGSVINNRRGSGFVFSNNQTIFGTGTFNNQAGALFQRIQDAGTATVQAVFNNSGDVQVRSGTLSLNGGGNQSGSFEGRPGTTLQFGGGAHDLQSTSSITASNVVFSGGTVTVSGTYSASDASTFNGATVTFNAVATLRNIGQTLTVSGSSVTFNSSQTLTPVTLFLTAGILTGSENITTGAIDWRGGTMSGAGTTTVIVAAPGFVEMSGSGMTLGRILTSPFVVFSLEGANSSLTLLTGAVLNGNVILKYAQGIFGTGTVNLPHDGFFLEVGSAVIQATFNNSGSVSVNDGTLTLSGGGTESGSFVSTVQGALEFAGGTFDFPSTSSISTPNVVFSGGTVGINGTYNVTGSSTFSGATVTFNSGTAVQNLGAAVTVSGGAVTFNTGTPFAMTALLLSGGTLNGSDNLTVTGPFTWWGGTMSGTGTTTANGGITIDGSGMTLARPLTNTGIAIWSGPGDIAATADAVFNNPLNAVFDIQNNQTFSGPLCIPVFNNAGIFRKEASYGITTIGLFFNNTGTVDIQTGTVNFSCGMLPPRPPRSPCHCRHHGSAQVDAHAHAQALNTSIVISEILRADASSGRLGADATGVIQTRQPSVLPDQFFALQGSEHGETAGVEPRHFFPAARGKVIGEMIDLLQGLFLREPGKEGGNQDILVGMD